MTTFASLVPIVLIVLCFCYFNVTPISNNDELILFGIGVSFLTIGASIFSFGADLSLGKIGNNIGNSLTKHKNIYLIFIVVFLIGFIITLAEPDLELLVDQINTNKWLLISIIALGIGIMFILASLRILFNINITYILLALYGLIFALAILVDQNVIPFVFDSGGVTTGSVSVPFIISLGVGLSSIKKINNKDDTSFGFTGIVSSGPLIVLLIYFIFSNQKLDLTGEVDQVVTVGQTISSSLIDTLVSTSISIFPILAFYLIYDFIFIKSKLKEIIHILIGILIVFIGLIFFLSGANLGLIPIGRSMGKSLVDEPYYVLLFSIFIGAAIIYAEPSVRILGEQVENLSEGIIKRKQLFFTLAVGNIFALLLSLYKVIYEINLLYIIVPGYILIFALALIVPKQFVAVAFDSGGVASGTLTAAFITPIASGMALEKYNNDVSLASSTSFGVAAIVAMIPLLVVELLGLNSVIKAKLIYKKARERIKEENENQVIHFA